LFGTKIATLYVQPHIGGDLALLTGIAKRIDEMGAQDAAFLQEKCSGSEEWLAALRAIPWAEIHAGSGVGQKEIDQIAERYAAAKNAVFGWTMGITHHVYGVENVQAITNLALMRGMVGRPNAGVMPIRGHSNVQGIGSMAVAPNLKKAVFEALEREFKIALPTSPGWDTMACMEAAHEGRAKVGFCVGGNLYGSNPDATYAKEAIGELSQIAYVNTTLNTGHAHGLAQETIILPVLARDEEPEPTTQESMFNYVRLSDGGPRRHEGPRSEVRLLGEIAEQTLGNAAIDWSMLRNLGNIRAAIAKVIPGFEQLAEIERTKQEFQIPGRTLHGGNFPTADGRAKLFVHSLPELAEGNGTLRLMTVRSEGQFNTVVYEDEDIYRGQERRDVILLHPDDIRRLRLHEDQRVTVRSQAGVMRNILVRSFPEIRAGNALMYYPEANVLVPRTLDPKSRTPAFKNIAIRIEASVPVAVAS
jgi:molybdopterin-dependent oxidoreductase alpha subunit